MLNKPKTTKNPYLDARKEWNSHTNTLVSSKNGWQFLALASLLIALAAVGGNIYIGNQSKFIPYVVEVDKLGQILAIKPADKSFPADVKVVKAMISNFINDARIVTPDVIVQRKAILDLYAMLNANDPATLKMGEWFNATPDSKPFSRAAKKTVSIEIESILPLSKESWQVDWMETERSRDGEELARFRMRAVLNVYSIETTSATTEEQIRSNPLGLFVRDFSWSKQP